MKQASASKVPISCGAVSLILLKKVNGVCLTLLMQRVGGDLHGVWCPIAGGIEPGEAASDTVWRECLEETSLVQDRLYVADFCESFYGLDGNSIELIPVFVGYIESDQKVVLNEEHSDFVWLPLPEAVQKVIFPAQKESFLKIQSYFVEQVPSEVLRLYAP